MLALILLYVKEFAFTKRETFLQERPENVQTVMVYSSTPLPYISQELCATKSPLKAGYVFHLFPAEVCLFFNEEKHGVGKIDSLGSPDCS